MGMITGYKYKINNTYDSKTLNGKDPERTNCCGLIAGRFFKTSYQLWDAKLAVSWYLKIIDCTWWTVTSWRWPMYICKRTPLQNGSVEQMDFYTINSLEI